MDMDDGRWMLLHYKICFNKLRENETITLNMVFQNVFSVFSYLFKVKLISKINFSLMSKIHDIESRNKKWHIYIYIITWADHFFYTNGIIAVLI